MNMIFEYVIDWYSINLVIRDIKLKFAHCDVTDERLNVESEMKKFFHLYNEAGGLFRCDYYTFISDITVENEYNGENRLLS